MDPDRFRYSAENCSIRRTLDIVGERWTLLVLREAFYGVRRFADFHRALGCAKNLLSARLKTLVEEGILERERYRDPGARARDEYRLTEKGLELFSRARRPDAMGRPLRGRLGRASRRVSPFRLRRNGRRRAAVQRRTSATLGARHGSDTGPGRQACRRTNPRRLTGGPWPTGRDATRTALPTAGVVFPADRNPAPGRGLPQSRDGWPGSCWAFR